MEILQFIVSAIIILAAIYVYFIPSIEAHKKNHPQKQAILYLNVFAGWTLIGWVGSLVWAHTKTKESS